MQKYRRLVLGPFVIKHKAASDKVVANFKPCRVSDRPYVLRPRGLMPHSQFEGSVSVTLHPTYPNLLRPKLLDIGLSRLSSRRGLSSFVLPVLSPALCSVTLRRVPCLTRRLTSSALWTSSVASLLANHSLGAHDRFRCTLNVGPCRSIYPKACPRKKQLFLPARGRARLCRPA